MAGWLTLEAMMAVCLLMTCGNEQQTCLIAVIAVNCSVSKALCFPYLVLTALRSTCADGAASTGTSQVFMPWHTI